MVNEMYFLTTIIWLVMTISLTPVLIFFVYPVIAYFLSFISKTSELNCDIDNYPLVTILIVVRNAEDLIKPKIMNSCSLNYPPEKLEIVIISDGSTDRTISIAQKMVNDRVVLFDQADHYGKSSAINHYFHKCSGDIIIFSDVDAIIDSDAVLKLVGYFKNPDVGGVCGQRMIQNDLTKITKAQKGYIKLDSLIKKLENGSGSITSNDGKLFAMRKKLFSPIIDGVTDDMFMMLWVIKQNYRFVFEPDAVAFIRTPSRSFKHEIERRRRITTGSLKGIKYHKVLLNPVKYGLFSLKLLINKVIRRLIPVCLLTVFFSSLSLSFSNNFAMIFFIGQTLLYSIAIVYPLTVQYTKKYKIFSKVSALLWYFCLGHYGQFLGLIDFAKNKTVTKWDPIKDDTKIK